MTLRGTIRNGKVELDTGNELPDGTRVQVEPTTSTLLADLLSHAVHDPTMPKDYASEIDHYLHGTPKRNGQRATKSRAAGTGKPSRRAAPAKPKPKKRGR